MTMSGLRPKSTLLLAALAAWMATPASAQFFFQPFIGWSAHRFEEPATELAPQEVVELLARRGFRLAEPPRYVDDVIVAIGVDRRGGHVRFVLDADDGEILERRRLDKGVAQAPAPRTVAPHRHIVEQKRPAPPRRAAAKTPEPPKPRAATAHPPAPVRPAAPHVPPSEATKTPAAPAAATTHAPAPKAPESAPSAAAAAPKSPAPAAPTPETSAAAAPKPAAEWKAPSE